MCDILDIEEAWADEPEIPAALLMERTRSVDACRSAEPVSEELWDVFFGLRSGSIPWPQHEHMQASRRTAVAFLSARPMLRQRPDRTVRCTDLG